MQSISDLYRLTQQSSQLLVATACKDASHVNVDCLHTELHSMADQITAIKSQLASLSATVASTTTTQLSQQADQNAISVAISNLQSKVTTLQTQLSSATNILNFLQTITLIPAARKYTITNDGEVFQVDGQGTNPDLHILSGLTYLFDLSHNTTHPFIIKETASGKPVTSGIIHVNLSTGAITTGAQANIGHITGLMYWTIPTTQEDCVYESTLDPDMNGNMIF
jgi:hypothetical protein